jgi:hypothetical protein
MRVNELKHWWIHSWLGWLDVGPLGKVGPRDWVPLKGSVLFPAPILFSSLSSCHKVSNLLQKCSALPWVIAMAPANHGLEQWAKINVSSFKLICSSICHNDKEWLSTLNIRTKSIQSNMGMVSQGHKFRYLEFMPHKNTWRGRSFMVTKEHRGVYSNPVVIITLIDNRGCWLVVCQLPYLFQVRIVITWEGFY